MNLVMVSPLKVMREGKKKREREGGGEGEREADRERERERDWERQLVPKAVSLFHSHL